MRVHFVTTRHLTHMYTNTSEERMQCALSQFALAQNQIDHHHLGKQFLESWINYSSKQVPSPLPVSIPLLALSPSKATDWASLNESGLVCAHKELTKYSHTNDNTHTSSAFIQQKVLHNKMRKKMKTEGTVLNTEGQQMRGLWGSVIKGLNWQAQPSSSCPHTASPPPPHDRKLTILPRGSNVPQDQRHYKLSNVFTWNRYFIVFWIWWILKAHDKSAMCISLPFLSSQKRYMKGRLSVIRLLSSLTPERAGSPCSNE